MDEKQRKLKQAFEDLGILSYLQFKEPDNTSKWRRFKRSIFIKHMEIKRLEDKS